MLLEFLCASGPSEKSQGSKSGLVTSPSVQFQSPGHHAHGTPAGLLLLSLWGCGLSFQGTEALPGPCSQPSLAALCQRGFLALGPKDTLCGRDSAAGGSVHQARWGRGCCRAPTCHLHPGLSLSHQPAPCTTSLPRKQRGIYFVCKELIIIDKCI